MTINVQGRGSDVKYVLYAIQALFQGLFSVRRRLCARIIVLKLIHLWDTAIKLLTKRSQCEEILEELADQNNQNSMCSIPNESYTHHYHKCSLTFISLDQSEYAKHKRGLKQQQTSSVPKIYSVYSQIFKTCHFGKGVIRKGCNKVVFQESEK